MVEIKQSILNIEKENELIGRLEVVIHKALEVIKKVITQFKEIFKKYFVHIMTCKDKKLKKLISIRNRVKTKRLKSKYNKKILKYLVNIRN